MYKKKKTSSNVNKEEIVGEKVVQVMEMLRTASLAISPKIGSSPLQARRSSCGEVDQRIQDPSPGLDTIDTLTEPTVCSLLDSNLNMELTFATIYPGQEVCHTVLVEYRYVVVQPTFVWGNSKQIPLPIPVGDEIRNLGEALCN
jgi:hypothetical protein